MANITKRIGKNGNVSYLIRVFIDENSTGKQKFKSMTYKPAPGMTEKQIDKELHRKATLFEEKVKSGLVSIDGNITFEAYAEKWLETQPLALSTRNRYKGLLKRINPAIGHIRLEKLKAHHLDMFYKNLAEDGVKEKGCFATSKCLGEIMKDRKLSLEKLAKMADVAPSTVGAARKGSRISTEKANQIAAALDLKTIEVFSIVENTGKLSPKTIREHYVLISAILAKAKKERLVPFNEAAEFSTPPKVRRTEAAYLDRNEASYLIEKLLKEDDIRTKTSIILLVCSGLRRGELCGLTWDDINFQNNTISVNKALQYQPGNGIIIVPTKNDSSQRTIKIPGWVMPILSDYKKWWYSERFKNGSMWKGKQQFLFIQKDGKPINPDTVNFWLDKFKSKYPELPHFTPHSLRHTFATLQITAGVDIRTLQARTGHAQASTLLNTYSHAIQSAEEAAANALGDMLKPNAI